MQQLPYLHIPIVIPGNAGEEDKDVMARVQPEQIQCYYPGYYWGAMVYLLGGNVLITRASVEDLDHNIAKYWHQVNKAEKSSISLLQ